MLSLVRDRGFFASGLGVFAPEWFAAGTVEWASGANAGRRAEVMMQEVVASTVTITLLEVPVRAIGVANGFPNIPGQGEAEKQRVRGTVCPPNGLRYAAKGEANQGVVL